MRNLTSALCVIAWSVTLHAQLVINAGKDTLYLCQGQSIQIGGSPTAYGGRAPYRYQWEPAFGLSDPTASNPFLTAIRSYQQYRLTVTDADGAVAHDTILLIMFIPPRITAGGNLEVCVGQNIVLGGAPTAYGGLGPYRYEWFGLPSLVNDTVPNPTFVSDYVRNILVVLRVTDARGCVAHDTARITIAQPISINLPLRNIEICAGEAVQVGQLSIVTGGTEPYTVTWDPQIEISTPTIANPSVFPSQTRWYTVTVTDAKGCRRSDSLLVRVKPVMKVRLRDTSVCFGKEIQLGDSATVSGGIPPYRYLWEVYDNYGKPVSDTFDVSAPIQTIIPPASRIYRLIVRDAQGCVKRASMTVFVSEPPLASFAIPPDVCQGHSLVFGTGYNKAFRYEWKVVGAGAIIVGDPLSNLIRIRWDSSGTSTVSLSVHDSEKGCDYHADAHVRVHPLPQPVIRVDGRTHLCPGETSTLDAGEGFVHYVWSNGSRSRRITLSDRDAGTYTVTVTDTNGCTNSSPPQFIRANTTPTPIIIGPSKFCVSATAELRVTPEYARYLWSTGATTPTIIVTEPGTYTITVFDSIECPGTSPPFTIVHNPVTMDGGGNNQFLDRETLLDYPEQLIYFVNTDDEPLTIGNIRINPNYADLTITRMDINGRPITSIRGVVLRVGERLNVYLKYAPKIPDTAIVRLELEIHAPCPWTFIQPIILSSYDKRIITHTRVLDVRGAIGSTITIPITMQLNDAQDSIINATVDYTLRINARLLTFQAVHGCELISAHIGTDQWYVITARRNNVTLRNTAPLLLGQIIGTGLAASIFYDSVYIDAVVIRNVLKQPIVRIANGLLSLEPYCFPRDVMLSDEPSVQIQPNPVADAVTVTLKGLPAGRHNAVLATLEGQDIIRIEFLVPSHGSHTLTIPVTSIPSGVYILRTSTSSGSYHSLVVVSK